MRAASRASGLLLVASVLSSLSISRALAEDASTKRQAATAEESPEQKNDVPVIFRDETLLIVRAPIGTLTIEARARAIEDRLKQIAAGPASVLKAIHVEKRPSSSDLYAGDKLITSVTDEDAAPVGRTRRQLAADDAVRLHDALTKEFRGRSIVGILLGALYTILTTLVMAGAMIGLRKLFHAVRSAVRTKQESSVRPLRVQGLELLKAAQIIDILVRAIEGAWLLLIVVLSYLYLNLVLGFFPWTRGFASQLFGHVWAGVRWAGEGVLGFLPNLVYIALIVLVARYAIKLARFFFDELERGTISFAGFHAEWATPTFKIARTLMIAVAAVMAYPFLPGANSPAFQGVSIFFGLILSLGSTSAIGNVIAGIVLTYMRPFKDGDRVKIADTVGDVIERNLLVVRLRTIKNVDVTISNAMVLGNHIINYSGGAGEGLILNATVTIGYDAPWRQIHDLLISAAKATEGIVSDPAPFVFQTALDDFYVHYEINAYTKQPNGMARIYSALNANIQDAFNRANVEIMSPHYTSARDGNTIAIPSENLPKTYEAPSFRVRAVTSNGPAADERLADGAHNSVR